MQNEFVKTGGTLVVPTRGQRSRRSGDYSNSRRKTAITSEPPKPAIRAPDAAGLRRRGRLEGDDDTERAALTERRLEE